MKHIPHLLALFSLLLTVPASAQHPAALPIKSTPFVLGETIELPSKILSETRTLNIYLPEDYHKNDSTHYDVVYLLDGSADEDFIHVAGIFQFYNFPWIKQVPPSIVVGIGNVNRLRDFTFHSSLPDQQKQFPNSGHSDSFIQFIQNELQPFVEANFRTNHSKTIIGQSLGGLLATEILLKHPTLFNNYIIISPSLWWDNGSLLEQKSLSLPDGDTSLRKVYIAVGKEGLTPGKYPRVMEVDANLLAEQLEKFHNKNMRVHFDYLPDENHATISHQAILNALKLFYPQPVK